MILNSKHALTGKQAVTTMHKPPDPPNEVSPPEISQEIRPLLSVTHLSVTIDQERILDDVTFSVGKGEALVVIGPNGAGKTMLFRALLGLVPYAGIVAWRPGIHIGYVPQRFVVDRSMPLTVQEFFLLKSGRFWSPDHTFLTHLHHELSLVGLPDSIVRKPISEVSGGEFQRILISWAMLNHPDVLFCDEPTAGIDKEGEETVYQILRRLQEERGTTILLISHDLNVVYRYADNVLCLNRRVICHGVPHKVLNPGELSRIYGGGVFYPHAEDIK